MIMSSALGATRLHWSESTYSGTAGNCVAVAVLDDGRRAVRDQAIPAAQTRINAYL